MIDTLNSYYSKERKYSKISAENIRASRRNFKPESIYNKEYKGLSYNDRVKKAASNASDNGRCWWIYDYIIKTTITRKEV